MTIEPSAIILRFRDLVTHPGHTIANHEAFVSQHGYVWWGWWHKSGETVAADALNSIRSRLGTDKACRFYLFDSGHVQLRLIDCTDLHWETDYSASLSPEQEKTPDYYNQQKYKAWFKITSFGAEIGKEEVESTLHSLSYERIDDFFENKKSRYTVFYDKRIDDLDELKQQDRTIWFARPFKAGDLTHKVSIFSGHALQPSNFPEKFETSKSTNLLWLSDLHCGDHHYFPLTPTPSQPDVGTAIENAAKRQGISDFAGIIVSGDLTWKSAPTEFEAATNVVKRLSTSPSTLDNYRIVVCPGNHDLKFSDDPATKTRGVSVAMTEARRAYSEFYEALFYVAPNEYLSMGRRFLLGAAVPVEIVCLNSSLLQQTDGWFQGNGWVGSEQLKHAIEKYEWQTSESAPRPFRIVVLHHHLIPTTFAENPVGGQSYSVVLDAERLIRELVRHRVDLVLHGHMHNSFTAALRRPIDPSKPSGEWHELMICGMGSTGVKKDHREQPNMFGVISFDSTNVIIRTISIYPGNEESQLLLELKIPRAGGARNA